MKMIKEENTKLKQELETIFEKMEKYVEMIINKTTEAMMKELNSIQDEKENRTDLQLKAIELQLSQLLGVANASSSSSKRIKTKTPSFNQTSKP